MSLIKNQGRVKMKSIAQKLEAINRIASVVLDEVETFALRNDFNSENIDYYEELQRFEIELILYALYQANGNQTRAAQILNIKMTTLNAKIKRFNLAFAVSSDKDNTDKIAKQKGAAA